MLGSILLNARSKTMRYNEAFKTENASDIAKQLFKVKTIKAIQPPAQIPSASIMPDNYTVELNCTSPSDKGEFAVKMTQADFDRLGLKQGDSFEAVSRKSNPDVLFEIVKK